MIYTIKSITDKIENILESLAFILSPIKLYKIMRIFTTNTIIFYPINYLWWTRIYFKPTFIKLKNNATTYICSKNITLI